MTERHLGGIKATTSEQMPTLNTTWLSGDVSGVGGTFELAVSNSEPTLTLTVELGDRTVVERLDVQRILDRWVHGIVNDRVIQN